ncbi:MAG: hypothetical protein AMXMBFR46_23370 [Acidimicrobiia bacterium]
MQLDLASVLLQWAAGGLAFLWVTSRHRVLGIGYGWLLRSIYAGVAIGGVWAGVSSGGSGTAAAVRDGAAVLMAVAALVALAASVARRGRGLVGPGTFSPALDLWAPAFGLVAVVAAGVATGGNDVLAMARLVAGAAFLGCITDAMLLGHWYLVQPGLSRAPIKELVRWGLWITPVEIALMLVPTGMVEVLNGSIDDGWGGLIGWMWVFSALATLGLLIASRAALNEPYYSAVMATTGMLYLAILTAFGTDVMARAALSP